MDYSPSPGRYESESHIVRRCGNSGLHLSTLSLGLWQNFGEVDDFEVSRQLVRKAFDEGVIHFDLANNYGPPPGSAEKNFGEILKLDLGPWRDELLISTKAGYRMWPGPYGEWGSRKNLLSSLDRSLTRMGLDFVDIFYSHRPDPITPLEETMGALDHAVRSGKALYAGISNYSPAQTAEASAILKSQGTPCVIHQARYNMLDRKIEESLLTTLERQGIGCIVFSPLAQGLLTSRYLEETIPPDSRATKPHAFLKTPAIEKNRDKIHQLNAIAHSRGQTLAQMALTWVLRHSQVCSALIGASKISQLEENLAATRSSPFTNEELEKIDRITLGTQT